jgi:hypothetical protein
MKKCSKCKQELPKELYARCSENRDGLQDWCKNCWKEYRQKNQEKSLEYQKKYRKKYYELNKEKINARHRQNYKNYHTRPEVMERKRLYKKSLKAKNKRNASLKIRRKTDVRLKLKEHVSKHIGRQIKKNGQSSWDFLPYSVQELRNHLEAQFDENMNWENYGTYWHIDHIVPQSLFDIKELGDEQMLNCWSLINLQPLERLENISKGNKILPQYEFLVEILKPALLTDFICKEVITK